MLQVKSNTPHISIIIPCYKVEQYLSECLNSVINQTFKDWEAICVDDGSPDNCGKILDEYAKKDNRIKVIHQENKGLPEARNAAYQYISSPYTMFLDSDDVLHYQTLELAYNKIRDSKTDILWFDIKKFNDGDTVHQSEITKEKKVKIYKNPFRFYALKEGIFVGRKDRMPGIVTSKIYKSEFVRQTSFAPQVFPGEDNLFTLEITAKVNSLGHLSENLYFYRQRQGSIMHSLESEKLKVNMRKEIDWYQKIQDRLLEQGVSLQNVEIFNSYLAERVFFKKLFRPFIKGRNDSQSKEYIDSLINSEIFNFKKMKAKFRVILFFYKRNKIKLCRFLSCF